MLYFKFLSFDFKYKKMNIDLNLMKLDYCPEYFEIKIPNFKGGDQIYKSYLPFAMCLKCLGLIMTVY